jgi:hypothetical protein
VKPPPISLLGVDAGHRLTVSIGAFAVWLIKANCVPQWSARHDPQDLRVDLDARVAAAAFVHGAGCVGQVGHADGHHVPT